MNDFNFTLDNYYNVCVALDNRVDELEDRLNFWQTAIKKDLAQGRTQDILDIDNMIVTSTINELEALNKLINDLELHFNIKEDKNNEI